MFAVLVMQLHTQDSVHQCSQVTHSADCCAQMQPVVVALSGDVLEYMLSLAYVVGGALLGSPAGGEFIAAKQAATQVSHSCKSMRSTGNTE